MTRRNTTKAAGLLLLVTLLAPLSASAADPFDFSSDHEVPLVVVLHTPDGAPVRHARVTVTDRWRSTQVKGNVFFQGLTDEDGIVDTVIRLPRAVRLVDVIVSAPGLHGPYTRRRLRAQWGAFAPASRTTRSLPQLAELDIELEP